MHPTSNLNTEIIVNVILFKSSTEFALMNYIKSLAFCNKLSKKKTINFKSLELYENPFQIIIFMDLI